LHIESPAGLCPACLLTTAIEEGDQEQSSSGSRIQDYELLNEVARGGMGIVYRARQRVPPRIVALKMILPAHVGSVGAMKRFRAETEAAASLEHEGILPIYAVGEHDGAPFYSMKFAEGGTLADRLGQYRDEPRDAATLVAVLARAVAYAQQADRLTSGTNPVVKCALAAGYAEAGRFKEAVATAEQALDFAVQVRNGRLAEALQIQLDLYLQGLPFHEPAPERGLPVETPNRN